MNTIQPLPLEALSWTPPAEFIPYSTTDELEPLDKIIGQPRAIAALSLGAGLFSPGYNIFVSGLRGTGRLSTIQHIIESVPHVISELRDYCYVRNFSVQDEPMLLTFPAQQGTIFADAIREAIALLRTRIAKMYADATFRESRSAIALKYQQLEQTILQEFNKKIQSDGLTLGQIENEQGATSPALLVTLEGEFYQIGDIDELVLQKKLTQERAAEIRQAYLRRQKDVVELAQRTFTLVQEFRKALAEHDKSNADGIIEGIFSVVKDRFVPLCANVQSYINAAKEFLLKYLPILSNDVSVSAAFADRVEELNEEITAAFTVNVILHHKADDKVPVIVETTPSFTNLFGTIEKKYDVRGFWKTDHTHIKAGALLKADGGYLILNAIDMLSEPGVWKALKRVLLYRKLEIQSPESAFMLTNSAIKPEPVAVNLKVILIGDAQLYQLLHEHEEDFDKMFKVMAPFDYEIAMDKEFALAVGRFARKLTLEEGLLPLNADGMAEILTFCVAEAGKQHRATLNFSDIADLLREATYYTKLFGKNIIAGEDILHTLRERRYRNDLYDSKLSAMIEDGSIMIDTKGKRVGQINGLSVYSTGMAEFGKPTRITVAVGAGANGILNIEREVKMSGSIHDKGVFIIGGLLRRLFGNFTPLACTASITFEQSYSGVDGDSASSTEVYALLSALADVPLRQDIAVTGSINQFGDIQAVGGVTEKIEGFFAVCEQQGFTGTQGVIIPKANVPNLMLSKKIRQAVQDGNFHVYAVSRFEEGLSLLTGEVVGISTNEGFTDGSILSKALHKLIAMRNLLRGNIERKVEDDTTRL